jgi:DNA-binding MarR family transcriptional regulator
MVANSNHIDENFPMPPKEPSSRTRQRAAWYHAVRAHSALMELFERELDAECGMPLAWYDVLSTLYLSPDHSLRMSELAEHVLMSRSWLTRRVDQLVGAGLVDRCSAVGDRRGVQARLTREGKRTFIRLERSHGASVDRHFASFLNDAEAETVIATMTRIDTAARAALRATPCD